MNKQERIEEMEKIIKTERKMLGSQIKVIKKRLNNKYVEIEQLKAKNWRLTKKLRQVLLSIDTVKEMNTMCDIDEQRKQAVKEFAEKLKDLLCTVYGKHGAPLGDLTAEDIACEIDELLKEYERCGAGEKE